MFGNALGESFYADMFSKSRKFVGMSFVNPAFRFTRQTCIAASKTILREHKMIRDEEGPTFWIYEAFTVTASVGLVVAGQAPTSLILWRRLYYVLTYFIARCMIKLEMSIVTSY